MKKFANILGIVFFLVPFFADAYTISQPTASGNTPNSCGYATNDTGLCAQSFTTNAAGSVSAATFRMETRGAANNTYDISIQGDSGGQPDGISLGNSQNISQQSFPSGSNACAQSDTTFTWSGPVSLAANTTYWFVLSSNGSYDLTGGVDACGDGTAGMVGQQNGITTSDLSTWNINGSASMYFSVDVNSSSPPVRTSSIGDIINNSTTSIENVTGFGMNAMASWMWENLGKPWMGSGLAVLYTLRWYLMMIIALFIIIYFGYRYYGFFKT